MSVYYNEFDPFAAEWLRSLIKKGLIPDGEVDTRSITDVAAADLGGFRQCHFFAGIGGWSRALRLAGWPDDRPVWTGSCPCQPFSVAGKGKGVNDERHLWPVFFRLIAACRPPVVMGEQVSGAAGYAWFDGVADDLEAEGFACRSIDLAACSVGAPHIRNRLWWLAMVDANRSRQRKLCGSVAVPAQQSGIECSGSDARAVGHANGAGREARDLVALRDVQGPEQSENPGSHYVADTDSELRDGCGNIGTRGRHEHSDSRGSSNVADAYDSQRWARGSGWDIDDGPDARRAQDPGNDRIGGFWDDCEWLNGSDGKARRTKPGVCLLANGIPNRVGRLRGYGNAIVPQVAEQVIRAFMDTEI